MLFASLALVIYACGGNGDAGPTTPDQLANKNDAGAGGEGGTIDPPGGDDDDTGPAGGSPVPYDRATMKSTHNSYERDETLVDQLLYHRVRSVELDIHNGKNGAAPAGDWWVYHGPNVPGFNDTSCTLLSDCLGAVAAFHAAVPLHEVITVWIDLKDSFEASRQPADLEAIVEKTLGRDNILTPGDLIAKCDGATTVRAAVAKPCGFPSLGSLRGKIMLTVTGGSKCDANSNVATYGGAKPRDRLLFLAPDLNGSCPPAEYEKHPDVVIFNMSFDDRANAKTMRDKGLVSRIYKGGAAGGFDKEDEFLAAKEAGGNHLATDLANFEQDPWSKTHGAKGFPFSCEGCDGLEEEGNVLGVSATSGDQWDAKDSAFYALTESDAAETWTAMVGVPSSHTEDFAKACLVARASDDPGAPNVAFCRPFDANPPRIQIRNAANTTTTTRDAPPFTGLSAETVHFLRLDLKSDGAQTQINAQVSRDGTTWVSAHQSTVNAKLPLRGVSVSSHGTTKRRALFAKLTRSITDLPPEKMTSAKLPMKKAIGAAATGAAFDGVFGP